MMTEISLNILDVVQNSISANSTLIEISINAQTLLDELVIVIKDNGKGMSFDTLTKITDPFYTTRTTRKVGLGIPFYKYSAESTGGSFNISSEVNVGTEVYAKYVISHIDRMPLGDINSTVHVLITMNTEIDFVYNYKVDDREFTLDTRHLREILGGIDFSVPEVSKYIKEFLFENKREVDGGVIL